MFTYSRPKEYITDLGDGFVAKAEDAKIFEKYDLAGQGILHFVNSLSTLVEDKKEELPEADWKVLADSLKRLMIDYEGGDLYYFLVHTYGADALNYNAWVHFSMDCVWSVCVRTFTDMPTEIIEEYGVRHWTERNKTVGPEGARHITEALHNRTDIYGANGGMPAQLVQGILFTNNIEDSY